MTKNTPKLLISCMYALGNRVATQNATHFSRHDTTTIRREFINIGGMPCAPPRIHGGTCISDASGVEPKAAPGGQIRETCCMSDGRIDTVAGRAVEPPWRLNGRRGGADCAKQ